MTKLKTASLLMLVIIGMGCSKKTDSNNQPTPSSPIVGKWNYVSDSVTVYTDGKRTSIDQTPDAPGTYRQFNKDGTSIDYYPADSSYPALSVHLTYSVSSNKLTLNYPTYTAYGIPFNARTDVWDIIQLTDHQLGIKFTDQESTGGVTQVTTQYFYYSK